MTFAQALRDDSPGGWQEDGELDADVRRALDNSKEQLDLIIKEVCDKVIMAEAMAILSGNEQSTSAEVKPLKACNFHVVGEAHAVSI